MHDQPTPTEEEQEQAGEPLEKEEAQRGTGYENQPLEEEESEG